MTEQPDDITAILDQSDLVQREARDVILKLREQTTWRTIESAPHETAVLLYCPPSYPSAVCMEVAYASSGREWTMPDGGRYSSKSWHPFATHWMPLPLPPPPKDATP